MNWHLTNFDTNQIFADPSIDHSNLAPEFIYWQGIDFFFFFQALKTVPTFIFLKTEIVAQIVQGIELNHIMDRIAM